MSKLKSRGCITSYDIGEAEREGKLNIADNIDCPFCEREVTKSREDARGVSMPFCSVCSVFLMFVWKIDASGLSVRLSPKPKDATHTNPGEIAEDTRDTEQPIALQEKETTQNNTGKTNRKKDVAGQILSYLTDKDTSATTDEMLNALDCSRASLNNALKQLVKSKQVRKVRRGVYKIA